MRIPAVMLAMGLTFVAAIGCSSPQSAPARPPTRLSPPIVGDPINLAEFEKAPCGLMGPDQLAQFYISATGTVSQIPAGTACTWSPNGSKPPSYQTVADLHSGGLEALYRKRSSIPTFQPITIHSYPAVHISDDPHEAPHGRCTVDVGVADDTLVIVIIDISDPRAPNYDDPCTDADRFANILVGYQGHRAP